MEDYKFMYYTLFNKITDVIHELEEVQRKAEELYLLQDSDHINTQSPNQAELLSDK